MSRLPKESGIYLMRNKVSGLIYIGQSFNIYRRVNAHFAELKRGAHNNIHLQRAYNKYGREVFEVEVLELCENNIDKLNGREIFYIEKYDSFRNGYNQTPGGYSHEGCVITEETRARMRASHPDVSGKNNPMYGKTVYDFLTEEEVAKWKHNISVANTGYKNGFYGKKHTEETKQKISAANKGRLAGEKNPRYGKPLLKEVVDKMREGHAAFYARNSGSNSLNAHRIVCLNTGEKFGCLKDACERYGLNSSALSNCCSGKTYSCGEAGRAKLTWMYEEDYLVKSHDEIMDRIIKANSKHSPNTVKRVLCINTGRIYNGLYDAAEDYGLDPSSISKVCRGKNSYCGRDKEGNHLKWEYIQ